jgi:hypothetical protein
MTTITIELPDDLAAKVGPLREHLSVSGPVQDRLRELLDKNREEGLTEAENAELDVFESVEDLMGLLKAKAHCVSSD